jgi:DUF1680 family protein
MWSHQYLQQMNQIWVQDMHNNPFVTDGSYSDVMGLEPNYPCCAVNHGQGWPKFVSNAFVTANAGAALVQAYLAPVAVSTTLAGGHGVNVTVATNYPFADTLNVTTSAQAAYTHYVRVPEWAKRNGKATISLNGGAAAAVTANADSLFVVAVPKGQYHFTLTFPANIEVAQGAVGVSVNRGPLLFASDIFRKETILSTSSVRRRHGAIRSDPDHGVAGQCQRGRHPDDTDGRVQLRDRPEHTRVPQHAPRQPAVADLREPAAAEHDHGRRVPRHMGQQRRLRE